jgi:hypothetical protein
MEERARMPHGPIMVGGGPKIRLNSSTGTIARESMGSYSTSAGIARIAQSESDAKGNLRENAE